MDSKRKQRSTNRVSPLAKLIEKAGVFNDRRSLIIFVASIVVVWILLLALVHFLTSNRGANEGLPVYIDESSGEIDEEAAIRVGCISDTIRLDFFLDNTYEVSNIDSPDVQEQGTYIIRNNKIIVKNITGDTEEVHFDDKSLTYKNNTMTCEEYGRA